MRHLKCYKHNCYVCISKTENIPLLNFWICFSWNSSCGREKQNWVCVCDCEYMCVCVCVCMRKREQDRALVNQRIKTMSVSVDWFYITIKSSCSFPQDTSFIVCKEEIMKASKFTTVLYKECCWKLIKAIQLINETLAAVTMLILMFDLYTFLSNYLQLLCRYFSSYV